MKTVGIVGGLDFLGCDITLKFLSEDYFVKVLDLPRNKDTPMLINTSIKAGAKLKIFSIDLNSPVQLSLFTKGCDFLIHCGRPYRLDVKMDEGALYIPVITDSGCLLKVIHKSPSLKKIIFLTSVAVLNLSHIQHVIPENEKQKILTSDFKKHSTQSALFHSEKIISKTIVDISVSRLEIVHVSPVVVYNNMLINSKESTLKGLQYLFGNQIVHDRIFQKLVSLSLIDSMINAGELPDKIFSSCECL